MYSGHQNPVDTNAAAGLCQVQTLHWKAGLGKGVESDITNWYNLLLSGRKQILIPRSTGATDGVGTCPYRQRA